MAITIQYQPFDITVARQRLMFVAISSNVLELGFRYKVTVTTDILVSPGTVSNVFYISPNLVDTLIFDAAQLLTMRNMEGGADDATIHATLDVQTEAHGAGLNDIIVEIMEAWIVGGVLTDDPDNEGAETVSIKVFNGYFEYSQGYKPLMDSFVMDGDNKRVLSDRLWNTRRFNLAATYGLPTDDTAIYIPVIESDYGVFSVLNEITGNNVTQWFLGVCDASNVIHDEQISVGTEELEYWPFFPANLNANESLYPTWPRPSDYPGWKYIIIYGMDDGSVVSTAQYILYNMEVAGEADCKYDRVRLAWVNSRGGWDYQNFTKKSEVSHSIERKNYRKVIGLYEVQILVSNLTIEGW